MSSDIDIFIEYLYLMTKKKRPLFHTKRTAPTVFCKEEIMKKRYLALILACFMTVSLTLSACGSLSDAIVREEDDEKDQDEDKDDDEEEEEEIVYVDTIDEDDLEDQIKVIVKKSDEWIVPSGGSAAIDHVEYCVTDLDHNGRAEVISVQHFEYEGATEVHIYEVDEKCKGLKEAKWKYKGVEVTSDKCPDFAYDSYISTYYDKKKNETHFLMDNYFDNGNGEYGITYCELTYSEGKMVCWNYGAFIYGDEKEFFVDDGTEIDNMDDFVDYMLDYPKRRNEKQAFFGMYKDFTFEKVRNLDDSYLSTMLTDSYRVYAGEYDFEEFYEKYNIEPLIDDSSTDIDYDDLVGSWMLYSSDDGYETEYYDKDSNGYFVIEIRSNMTAIFYTYFDGKESLKKDLTVYESSGYWILELRDPEGDILDEDLDYVQFMIMDMADDGQDIYVYNLVYDKDGYIEEGYEMVFIKDKTSGTGYSADASLDRYIGEWELVSSEIEGDVTYYEPNGSFNATLTVSEDGMASFKEYRNRRLDLEINAELAFNNVGLPYFGYGDEDALTAPIAFETYTFYLNIADYNSLDVYLDFYDEDGELLGGCVLTFEKTYG